jgi:hypothetical protein
MTTPRESDLWVRTAQLWERTRISGYPVSAPDARKTILPPPAKADMLFDAPVDYPVAPKAANEDLPEAKALQPEAAARVRAAATGWDAYEIWHGRIRVPSGVTSLFVPSR